MTILFKAESQRRKNVISNHFGDFLVHFKFGGKSRLSSFPRKKVSIIDLMAGSVRANGRESCIILVPFDQLVPGHFLSFAAKCYYSQNDLP